jgi:hypothetical protein
MSEDIEEIIMQTVLKENPATLSELIDLLETRSTESRNVIAKSVLRLQREGKISIQELSSLQAQYNSTTYLKTRASLWFWVTIGLTLGGSLVVFAVPNIGPFANFRYVFASVFVLLLPGFALLKALFPSYAVNFGKTDWMDGPIRFAFSVVLSIAVVSVLGLFLDYTPWGINLDTLVVCLSSFTVILSVIALLRERRSLNVILGQVEIEPERSS